MGYQNLSWEIIPKKFIYDISHFWYRIHTYLGHSESKKWHVTYNVKIASFSPFILHKVVWRCRRRVRVKPLPAGRSSQPIHLKVELVTAVNFLCCCTAASYYKSTSTFLLSQKTLRRRRCYGDKTTFILSYLFLVLLHSDAAGIQKNKAGGSYYAVLPMMMQRFCLLKAGCH